MPLNVTNPNQASGQLTPSTTTTDSGMAFGFPAQQVTLVNDRATAVYVTFASTSPSTGGYRTCAGESLAISGGGGISGLAVASTTTSTGTVCRVLALGW